MSSFRIFISSVMRDFSQERSAARQAVEALGHEPVMAEDFGAQPNSPQLVCLEGVRRSHVYLGIFGGRYGFVAPSGLSATEEEFNEARRLRRPILCFVQNIEKDDQQNEFLSRLTNYEDGFVVDWFDSTEDLQLKIVKSLQRAIRELSLSTSRTPFGRSEMEQYLGGSRRDSLSGTWLGTVILPDPPDEQYLSPLVFGRDEFRQKMLRPAIFGPSAFMSTEFATVSEERETSLSFHQQDERRDEKASLEVYANGTLVLGRLLSSSDRGRGFLWKDCVISESEVRTWIERFINYSSHFIDEILDGPGPTRVGLGVGLTGIRYKAFGVQPSGSPQSITMPNHNFGDRLYIPEVPLETPAATLKDSGSIADRLTQLLARSFRLAGAYYS